MYITPANHPGIAIIPLGGSIYEEYENHALRGMATE